jgi:hypothetical protein
MKKLLDRFCVHLCSIMGINKLTQLHWKLKQLYNKKMLLTHIMGKWKFYNIFMSSLNLLIIINLFVVIN